MRENLKKPLPLKDLLGEALKPAPGDLKTILYHLQSDWGNLVGPTLSRKSFPVRVLGKRLIVEVAGSVWANELEFLKHDLLEKIKSNLPDVPIENMRFEIAGSKRG